MKIIKLICVFMIVFSALCVFSHAVSADGLYSPQLDKIYQALPPEAREYASADLSDSRSFRDALAGLARSISKPLENYIREAAQAAFSIAAVCAICACVRTFAEESAKAVLFAGTAAIASVYFGQIKGMLILGKESMESLFVFGKTLLPTLCAAQVMSGAAGSAGVVYTSVLFVGDIVMTVISRMMTPLVSAYCALITAACISENDGLSKLAKLIKSGTVWALKILIGIFTCYLTVSGAITVRSGIAAVRSLKLASSAVPLISGVISDAAEVVAAGAKAAQGVIGAAGLIGIAAIVLVPFMKMAVLCAALKIASALSAMTGAGGLSSYADQLSDGFVLVLALCAAFTLIIMIGIFAVILGVSAV